MSNDPIIVRNLSKFYQVSEREAGLVAALKSLAKKQYRIVEAVKHIDFVVKEGEMVGFIGPNGAGKTTTLKMLSGLLYPTGGEALVLGFTPWKRQPNFLRQISMVLGWILHPEIKVTWESGINFGIATLMAWAIRFFWGYWIALLAFWATQANALLAIQDSLTFLLAGQIAPVALLPGVMRTAAHVFPFRYMIGFPVEVLTGKLAKQEILEGFYFQTCWLVVTLVIFFIVWRKGTKQYSAVGG